MADVVSAEALLEQAYTALERVRTTQFATIRSIAGVLAERIGKGGVVHVFGTGHSKAFAMELANRAGGLVPMHAMSIDDLLLRDKRVVHEIDSPQLERDEVVARELLGLYDIRSDDAAILVSNSGRNGSQVEMALQLKARGLPVVCVSSIAHTTQVTSRHSSGKRLFEVADHVIDNCTPYGDALFAHSQLDARVCALSSITGAVIAQALTAEMIRALLDGGHKVPVLISANVDGSDAHNAALRKKYAGRI